MLSNSVTIELKEYCESSSGNTFHVYIGECEFRLWIDQSREVGEVMLYKKGEDHPETFISEECYEHVFLKDEKGEYFSVMEILRFVENEFEDHIAIYMQEVKEYENYKDYVRSIR